MKGWAGGEEEEEEEEGEGGLTFAEFSADIAFDFII